MGGGRFRHRSSNRSSAKIKSGSACESNPTKNKHRAAAMAARKSTFGGTSMLAVEDRPENTDADDMLSALPIDSMDLSSSSKSMISEGGITKISQFTSCTNPAFDNVNRIWKSGSSLQAEVISVLAAIAELIKERDGKESDVEYCAALITALEGSSLGNPKRTAAIAYLLHIIVRKVPKEVLQSQFSRFVQVLYTKLLENVDSTEGSALKNIISVLGIILRAQPASVWSNASTKNMLVSVAALAAHEKPWVRTMSRKVIRAVLTDPVTATDNGLHPASGAVGKFILKNIENFLDSSKPENTNVVRHLCLLEGIMHKMPADLFKKLAESMLKCFAISDAMVKCSALQCLHRTLQRQPCDSALPIQTNSLLLTALRQLGSSVTDITVTAYWLQALAETHVCLTAKDEKKSVEHAYQTLPLFVKMFESGNEQLAQVTYQALTRVIENSLKYDPQCGKFLLENLHSAVNLKSASVWKFILRAQMKLYEVCGDDLQGEEFQKVIEDLARLRESDDCFCKADLDFTIGAAVRHVGVEEVMNILSLEVDPDAAILSTDFKKSWLLPILRVNIHNAPIALFTTKFLPLAMKIHRRLNTLQPPVHRLYSTFQFQIWELLPSFCESPSDLVTSFPDIAPILGAALQERQDLRITILTTIRRAVKFSLQPDAPMDRTEVMSRYAKNFMPILFNMYTSSIVDGPYDDKGVRLAVLETIRVYAEATPPDLLNKFVDSAIVKSKENVDNSPSSCQRQARILDILCALVRVADVEAIEKVLDAIVDWFDSTDVNGLQKKSYRILEEIIQRRASADIEEMIEKRASYLEKLIIRELDSVTPPARAAYCSCIHMLVDKFESFTELKQFVQNTAKNVILMLDKDNNMHTRQNASKCLQFLCSKLIDLISETSEETPSSALDVVLSKIFEMTTINESSSEVPLPVARACLVALNIISQKQIKVLNTVMTSKILSFACQWILEERGPVRVLDIRLLRVLCKKMPEVILQQFRDQMLNAVFGSNLEVTTVKVRKANKILLDVLLEKFGLDVLLKYTTKPDWVKQMKNLDKQRRRKLRAEEREDGEGMEDDEASVISGSVMTSRTAGADTILDLLEDSDADDESDAEEKLMKRSQVGSVWLKNEGEGDGPVDLLDSSRLISNVTTMNPELLEKRKKKALERREKNEAGFKFTRDGRLIVVDNDDDKKGPKGRKRKGEMDDEDDGPTKAGKQQKEDSDLEDDIFSEDSEKEDDRKTTVSRATSYGGKGIYRDTSKKAQKTDKKQDKKVKNVQPYAYVPLRNKSAKQDVRKILKANRKSGKGVKKVVF